MKKPKKSKVMPCIPTRRAEQMIDMLDAAPASSGLTRLLKHLSGTRLTQREAILAKCCDCMGYYYDGKASCEMPMCPLYPYMPYREGEKTARNAAAKT